MRNRVLPATALESSEAELAFAVHAHALGLFEWDIATDALTWAHGSEAMLGLATGSVADLESWKARVFPDDAKAFQVGIADAADHMLDRFSFKYRVRGDDGRVRTIGGAARCIYDTSGTLLKAAGANIDVTERVEREAALIERETQLQSIMATMPTAMIVVDSRGAIRRFSAAAERLFGYAASDVIGRNVYMLAPDSQRAHLDGHLERYHAAAARGVSSEHFELLARRRDGGEVPVEISVGVATVGGEQLFTAFLRDLTEREQAEHAANDLRNDLSQIGRLAAMGEMAASLAHELNQPLTAAANFLAATGLLVERGGDREKIAELVDLANEQVQRAGNIIRNIREFIVKRDIEIRIEPIEKTIRDAVSLVLVGAPRLDIEVRYAFEQPNAFMLADRVQIQQVLVNLLRNAAEALHGQPKHRRAILLVVRSAPGDMIEISVNDTGSGIDADILEKIFTPLSSSKGKDGMGLGLSICRRIVESHGGTLIAENRMAGGATFRFTVQSGTLTLPIEE